MRILFLTTDAFGSHGGIAKYNQDFLSSLCAHPGCMEIIAIPRFITNSIDPLPSGLTYVTEGLHGKWKYIATTLKYIIRKSNYDLIICAHINLLPLAFFARLIFRMPLLLIIYGVDAWYPTKSVLTNYVSRNIDAFISISCLTKQRFISWAKVDTEKGFILANAIDLCRYKPGEKPAELLDRYGLQNKVVLMTLGRLETDERAKGLDEILELLPVLINDIPNIAYLVVGDGTDRFRLEDKVKRLGLTGHVVFTGFISEHEKVNHYRLADVYVMPSRLEGFGFVFLEAMACGIPVVASKVDGSREAVHDGKLGILVDPDKPEEIKAGILDALKRGRGVVPQGLDYFSYSNFEQRCHRIIDQILDSRKRGISWPKEL